MSTRPAIEEVAVAPGTGAARTVFPFFVGCGRSGTTLLRAMFDSHPEVAVAHETYFALWLGSHRERYERPTGFDTATFAADVRRHTAPGRLDLSWDALADHLAADPPDDTADAIRRVYSLHARHHGKARYAEKSPMFVRYIPFLARLFPEARFVHLVRDGRDVSLAFRDVDFGPSSPAAAAIHWRAQVQQGRAAGSRLGRERYREVRYEDLVDDPEATLPALCRFLELAYDPGMLRYFERAGDVVATTSFQTYHQSLFRPPTRGLRDWRTQMSSREVALFESLAGDMLDAYGYERAAGRPAIPLRLEAQLRRAGIATVSLGQWAGRRLAGAARRVVRDRS